MALGVNLGRDPGKGEDGGNGRVFYPHYAWVIVTVIAVMQMVGTSVRMAFGVFIEPLEVSFGWSQGTITLAYAITSLVTALSSPFAGWFGDRFGARKAMAVGTALFLVGMILTGYISQPWHLYLYFGVLLGVAQAMFLVPLIPAAMLWFRRHLGVGMGLIMAAWGLGPALAAPAIGAMIQYMEWQQAFLALGVGSALIMAGLIVVFRNKPSDRGILPYGHRPGDPSPEEKVVDPQRIKMFNGHMRRTAAYWNLSSIHFLGCVGHAVILIYIIPLAVSEGLSLVTAAALLTVMSAVSIISRIAVPILCEHMGTRTVMAIFYFLQGITVVSLFWTHDPWMFYLFAVLFGIGYGGETGGFPILNRKYYGHAPTGSPYGIQMLGAGLGMALGGWVGGPIYDMTGSYDLALMIAIVASLAGMVSIVVLEPTHKILIPDWEVEQVFGTEGHGVSNPEPAPTGSGAD
ncbi:MAG: hypothetical protein BZY79_01150 [SAR202 cluster bacterium Casp-Chloro-G4]|nr:MFS transporter [Chloroflexota bacterium]MDA1226937.1 MFS transporter [Chloroflexota bacterium]PKB61966.1 MAG: hypothetical protein BZY79_01150 [SAR202 cluster bacterium Casp-Chloro-G4]